MIEMRDGVRLATDVYLSRYPQQPHGAILLRTPYDKNDLRLIGFLGGVLGWPIIIQDIRGKHASEGDAPTFRYSLVDGPDTIAWIANQSWCNGKIATIGPSALGIDQYLTAGSNPDHLACQFIQVAMPNLYKYAVYPGGEYRKSLVDGWIQGFSNSSMIPELHQNENYTKSYWGYENIEDDWHNISIPAIHIGGWYDIYCQGILDGFYGYQHLSQPQVQGKSKLIMGPWTHEGSITTQQGQLRYPLNSLDTFSLLLFYQMIRQYTMDIPTFFDRWPAVTYYVMGDVDSHFTPGNEWRTADDWPIPSHQRSWYFHADGSLQLQPMTSSTNVSYFYDPTDPVPTIGGQNLMIPAGPYDQSGVEQRDDVLVFTSEELTQPYEATGKIDARLYVSSSCSDTDFTVKLTDVYPDGRSMLLTDGILRMRKRNGNDHWDFMEPEIVYNVTIDLSSTSYIWNTGHRIRVSVSSSNYPRFLANPNTKDGIAQNMTYEIAENTLHLSPKHKSCIILPEPLLE